MDEELVDEAEDPEEEAHLAGVDKDDELLVEEHDGDDDAWVDGDAHWTEEDGEDCLQDPLEDLASNGCWVDASMAVGDETSRKLRRMAELLEEAELREAAGADGVEAPVDLEVLAERHAALLGVDGEPEPAALEAMTGEAEDARSTAIDGAPEEVAAMPAAPMDALPTEGADQADAAEPASRDTSPAAHPPEDAEPTAPEANEAAPQEPAPEEVAPEEPALAEQDAAPSEVELELRSRYLALLERAAEERLRLHRTLAEIRRLEVDLGLASDAGGLPAPPPRLAGAPPPSKRPRLTAAKSSVFAAP